MPEREDATSQNSSATDFGANTWLVEEMYKQYLADKNSVDASWWPTLEKYGESQKTTTESAETTAAPATAAAPAASAGAHAAPATGPATQPARTTNVAPRTTPIPAEAPRSATSAGTDKAGDERAADEDQVTPLRGMAKTLSTNMDESLTVPTATSVRTIPAKLLIDNRIVINSHLRRSRGGKVSFTHLIGWALIQTLKDFPSQNVSYAEVDGKPSIVVPAHIGLGIAIDLPKPDGSRSLMVPSIKRAETLDFNEYLAAYEDLVKRARDSKLTAADFQGTTLSLTNPGGIGTVHSVPRLMKGQGCIIGEGALE